MVYRLRVCQSIDQHTSTLAVFKGDVTAQRLVSPKRVEGIGLTITQDRCGASFVGEGRRGIRASAQTT